MSIHWRKLNTLLAAKVMEDSQFSQQRYFMICPLKQELDEDAEADPLSGRSSGCRLRRCARPPDGHQLALCADLYRSHFTQPVCVEEIRAAQARSAHTHCARRSKRPVVLFLTLLTGNTHLHAMEDHSKPAAELALNIPMAPDRHQH